MGNRTRVVAYVRVSTEAQADIGVSLDAQRAKVAQYAALYDLDIVTVIEDAGQSAKSLQRPGLARVLAMLEAGEADGLLIAKLDRLTRSVRDLGTLLDRGFRARWALLSVAEQVDTRSAGGRLVLNVLASVSEWERDAIAERTRDALAQLKAEGVRLGGEALGWSRAADVDEEGRRQLQPVQEERETIHRIFVLHAEGHSLREIARRLEAEGHRTKRGGRWAHATVRKVLDRAQVAA